MSDAEKLKVKNAKIRTKANNIISAMVIKKITDRIDQVFNDKKNHVIEPFIDMPELKKIAMHIWNRTEHNLKIYYFKLLNIEAVKSTKYGGEP